MRQFAALSLEAVGLETWSEGEQRLNRSHPKRSQWMRRRMLPEVAFLSERLLSKATKSNPRTGLWALRKDRTISGELRLCCMKKKLSRDNRHPWCLSLVTTTIQAVAGAAAAAAAEARATFLPLQRLHLPDMQSLKMRGWPEILKRIWHCKA